MGLYQGDIIDAHMHLWDIRYGYEWTKNKDPFFGGGALHRNYLASDFIAMCANSKIKKFVHVECGGFPEDPVLETRWVQQQSNISGMPQAIVAYAKLDDPKLEEQLKRHAESPNLRGIRMLLSYDPALICLADRGDYMQNSEWLQGFALLSKYNLSFDMQIHDTQLPQACSVAQKFPETLIILDHLGSPSAFNAEGFKYWQEQLAKLAEHSNVRIKLSCLGCLFKKNDPELIIPYIQEAVRLFGADRCMVGSNCPPDAVHIPLDDIFDLMRMACINLPESQQHQIFYETANQSYRLSE